MTELVYKAAGPVGAWKVKSLKRNSLIAVIALGLIAGGVYFFQFRTGERPEQGSSVVASVKQGTDSGAKAAPAPQGETRRAPPVEIAAARAAEAVTELLSVGTLASDESVAIAAEVPGRVSDIGFREGQPVEAGTVLVKLDSALARAELAEAESTLKLANSNFTRATSLSQSGAGTQRARDEALSALETARATQELASVRLDKTEVRAPFAGVVGLRNISVGAYVQIGQTLVNLEKIDTLKLDFRLPEVNLRDVQVGQSVEITIDAYPDRKFGGTVYAIDPLVDANGRALKIRARLANPDNMLRPGLFARVTLQGMSRGRVVLIPEGAIVPRGGDSFVFTVQDDTASEAKVTLGRRSNGEVEVLEGLPADATVVVAGQSRVRNGQRVEVVTPRQPG